MKKETAKKIKYKVQKVKDCWHCKFARYFCDGFFCIKFDEEISEYGICNYWKKGDN